jgi:crossover junction endodeoxyribonuclease RusA
MGIKGMRRLPIRCSRKAANNVSTQPLSNDQRVVIDIPMAPPREVSPNARVHWRAKARATREFREAAAWATLDAEFGEGVTDALFRDGIVIDAEIQWGRGRKRIDDDNAWASLKAARDGIAGMLQTDDAGMRCGRLTQTRGDGRVIVTLRGREGA